MEEQIKDRIEANPDFSGADRTRMVRTENFIDNTATAYALAKGHSTAGTINNMIRGYLHKRPHRICYIATHEQRADGPTRGYEPAPRKDIYDSIKEIPSFFTA